MAIVMSGGSTTFDSLAYSAPHPGTQQFLQNQLQVGTHLLNEAGSRFISTAKSIYDRVSGSDAMRIARAASRAMGNAWGVNSIRELNTIGALQNAPPVMERWIMAEPTIRKLYHEQKCDGYSDSYVDAQPGVIGEDHYDYRRVMNGAIQENEEGGWFANCYYDEMLMDEEELHMDEQFDIISTWSEVVNAIRNGKEDPTSKWNSDL